MGLLGRIGWGFVIMLPLSVVLFPIVLVVGTYFSFAQSELNSVVFILAVLIADESYDTSRFFLFAGVTSLLFSALAYTAGQFGNTLAGPPIVFAPVLANLLAAILVAYVVAYRGGDEHFARQFGRFVGSIRYDHRADEP
ncbi:hypothetical protein [Haloarchaeobius sp. DFWS5]|uniref:hypothetical protein n=1 Tax=Haloarchaeobius sp. DFWS5 TaxID=3446114 RepID=UPI003EBD60DD